MSLTEQELSVFFDLALPVSVSKKVQRSRSYETETGQRAAASSWFGILCSIRPVVVPAGGRGGADTLIIHGRPHAWCLYSAAVVPMRCDTTGVEGYKLCSLACGGLYRLKRASSSHFHIPDRLVAVWCLVNFKKFTTGSYLSHTDSRHDN